MTRLHRTATALVAMTLMFAAIAQDTDQPVPPPPTPMPVVEEPMVRVVHLSPNASSVSVTLVADDAAFDERHVVDLDYLEASDYVSVREGTFDIVVDAAAHDEGTLVLAERLQTVPGGVYTVALIGLALDDVDVEAADDGGFLAWLQGLFTPDRPELALRALILDDVAVAGVGPTGSAVRVVHAAPGTDALEFVQVRDDATEVLASVSYRDVSGVIDIVQHDGTFEMRLEGADATIAVADDVDATAGRIDTVFLVGTPIEDAPLEMLVVSTDWALVGPLAPGAPRTDIEGHLTPSNVLVVRELMIELGARIEIAEQRLDALDDMDDEALADARRELEDAAQLLEQMHLVLDTVNPRLR